MKKPATPKTAKTRTRPQTRSFSVRLDVTMIERVDRMARDNGTKRNSLIQIAIARLLKQGLL